MNCKCFSICVDISKAQLIPRNVFDVWIIVKGGLVALVDAKRCTMIVYPNTNIQGPGFSVQHNLKVFWNRMTIGSMAYIF